MEPLWVYYIFIQVSKLRSGHHNHPHLPVLVQSHQEQVLKKSHLKRNHPHLSQPTSLTPFPGNSTDWQPVWVQSYEKSYQEKLSKKSYQEKFSRRATWNVIHICHSLLQPHTISWQADWLANLPKATQQIHIWEPQHTFINRSSLSGQMMDNK